jgi:hypothetical protein
MVLFLIVGGECCGGKLGCGVRVDRVRLAWIPLAGLGATVALIIHMRWVPCNTW